MSQSIKKAAAETLEILSHLPKELANQIPHDFLEKLETISLKKHIFSIDDEKTLLEQNLSKDTINILIIIYRLFWCNEEERKNLDKMLVENEKEFRKSIYKSTSTPKIETTNTEHTTALVEYKDTIFEKIKLFINKFIWKKCKR